MVLPQAIQQVIKEAEGKLAHRPGLLRLFKNCFPNTLETTTKLLADGTTFVFTGDIPAMWLRDSVEQVRHYVPYAKEDRDLQRIISGLIRRQIFYINLDPYANAFNEEANDQHWRADDQTDMTPWVWERKYEVDSLCFPIDLAYAYWKETGLTDIFDESFREAMETIVHTWKTEQHHGEKSTYRFQRDRCPEIDTLRNDGMGMPVNDTGMTWSGFRPSDDACQFGYHIPSNMFAAVVLDHMKTISEEVYQDSQFALEADNLRKEIDYGIKTYGIYRHPKFGEIYAYETDGYGNYCLMDDAGTPSLLSIPYLGYASADDPIYQNTRKFIFSHENPYYFEGKYASGVGSPHTPDGYVWHLGLTMQALTAKDPQEVRELVDVLEETDAGTGFMHEGFDPDDPSIFTREWFAWSNSQFSNLMCRAMSKNLV